MLKSFLLILLLTARVLAGLPNDNHVEHYYYDGARRIQEVHRGLTVLPGEGDDETSGDDEGSAPVIASWTDREYIHTAHMADVPVEAQVLPAVECLTADSSSSARVATRRVRGRSTRTLVKENWICSGPASAAGRISVVGRTLNATVPSLEFEFAFRYSGHSSLNATHSPLSVYSIHINAKHLVRIAPTDMCELLVATFEHFEEAGCEYGLVDLARGKDTSSGEYYDITYGTSGVQFQRLLMMAPWLESGQRPLDRTRGVFWGNFLGRAMAERAGSSERLIDQYRSFQGGSVTGAKVAKVLPAGGCLMCASGDFMDPMRQDAMMLGQGVQKNAVWIYQTLGRAGLLP